MSDLELEQVRIKNTIEILNNNLVTVAGLPEGSVVVPDSAILLKSLPVQGEDWWQQEAAVSSPSLSLARNSVDICRKAETIVRAERMPKIGIQAGWTMDGPILVEIPPVNRNLGYWYVGVGVSYNLSSLYKSNKSLARSRAATRKAMDELDVAEENVSMAVRTDHVRYLEAYETLKTRRKEIGRAHV